MVGEAAVQAKDLVREAATTYIENKILFLETATHELRNPVTAISLALQLAEIEINKGQPLNPSFLMRIRSPVDRLKKLVGDLLDVSGLARNLVTLTPVKTNMVSLISDCIDEFRIQAPKCSFLFHRPDQPVNIKVDPLRINQVLSNLLDNAVKYASGIIEVTLQVMQNVVRVEVTDHGTGIPKKQQKSLFNSFYRGSSEATDRTNGLGIGLSVCKGIMNLHNGKIGVESKEGQGSTFYFELQRYG